MRRVRGVQSTVRGPLGAVDRRPIVDPAVELLIQPLPCIPELEWDFDELVRGSTGESTGS